MHIITSQVRRGERVDSPTVPLSPQLPQSPTISRLPEYQARRRYILFTGVFMPLTVFMAIPAVVDKWEQESSQELLGDTSKDVLKPTGLATAVISNVALYARLLLYHVRLMTMITTAASGIRVLFILSALIVYIAIMPGAKDGFELSYASEWYMCIADVVISGMVFIVLLYDMSYARKHNLRGNGLSHQERFFINTIVVTTLWWSLGSIAFMYLEKWSFLTSLFFTLVTMSTVGFGNFAPTTVGSKLACVLFALVGVSLLGMLINSFATIILDSIRQQTMNRIAELRRHRYERRRQAAMNELGSDNSNNNNNNNNISDRGLELTPTDTNDVYKSVAAAKKEKEDIHGYGDFVPKSSAGEVTFILFCMTGLACMTYTGLVISQMRGEYVTRHIQRVEKILRRHGAPNGNDNINTRMTESASSTGSTAANLAGNNVRSLSTIESGSKPSMSMDREQAMNEILQATREMRRTLKSLARASVNISTSVSEPLIAIRPSSDHNTNVHGSRSAGLCRSHSVADSHSQRPREATINEERSSEQQEDHPATFELARQPTPLGRLVVWHHCHDNMERIIHAAERLLEIEQTLM
ncbi:hypothetical protein BDF22DRAFT_740639 [Syncephalis plumigaleata]|nr:hypothetical protein BDF22DRAFT_740639 [Syncephalis plumigaleata]